jgi:hypothetical protein
MSLNTGVHKKDILFTALKNTNPKYFIFSTTHRAQAKLLYRQVFCLNFSNFSKNVVYILCPKLQTSYKLFLSSSLLYQLICENYILLKLVLESQASKNILPVLILINKINKIIIFVKIMLYNYY